RGMQQKVAGRSVSARLEASGGQQPQKSRTQRFVVVDYVDKGCRAHAVASVRALSAARSLDGNSTKKAAPSPARLSTQMRPPCASTIVRAIDRPSPMPACFVL